MPSGCAQIHECSHEASDRVVRVGELICNQPVVRSNRTVGSKSPQQLTASNYPLFLSFLRSQVPPCTPFSISTTVDKQIRLGCHNQLPIGPRLHKTKRQPGCVPTNPLNQERSDRSLVLPTRQGVSINPFNPKTRYVFGLSGSTPLAGYLT